MHWVVVLCLFVFLFFFLLKGSKERLFIDIDTQSVSLFVSLFVVSVYVCVSNSYTVRSATWIAHELQLKVMRTIQVYIFFQSGIV